MPATRLAGSAITPTAALSLVGAFGLLLLTGTPLNVSSMMGLILLVGLIVKNGIILVDYAHIVTDRGVDRNADSSCSSFDPCVISRRRSTCGRCQSDRYPPHTRLGALLYGPSSASGTMAMPSWRR